MIIAAKTDSPLKLEFGTPTERHTAFAHDLFGMKVIVHKAQPRYTLPEFLLPEPYCVPWPKGFKEETDQWAKEVCGVQEPLVKDGEVLSTNSGRFLHCNERTWRLLRDSPEFSLAQSRGSWMR